MDDPTRDGGPDSAADERPPDAAWSKAEAEQRRRDLVNLRGDNREPLREGESLGLVMRPPNYRRRQTWTAGE